MCHVLNRQIVWIEFSFMHLLNCFQVETIAQLESKYHCYQLAHASDRLSLQYSLINQNQIKKMLTISILFISSGNIIFQPNGA